MVSFSPATQTNLIQQHCARLETLREWRKEREERHERGRRKTIKRRRGGGERKIDRDRERDEMAHYNSAF